MTKEEIEVMPSLDWNLYREALRALWESRVQPASVKLDMSPSI